MANFHPTPVVNLLLSQIIFPEFQSRLIFTEEYSIVHRFVQVITFTPYDLLLDKPRRAYSRYS